MEVNGGGVAAFVGDFLDGFGGVDEEGAGVADADFVEEVDVGFFGAAFEVVTEGGDAHAGDLGDVGEVEGVAEVIDGVLDDFVEAVGGFGVGGFDGEGGERKEVGLLGE